MADALDDKARPIVCIQLVHQRGEQRHAAGWRPVLAGCCRAQLLRRQRAGAQVGGLAQVGISDSPTLYLLMIPATGHIHACIGDAPQGGRGFLETLAYQAVKGVHGNKAIQRPDRCNAVAGSIDLLR